MPSCKNERSSLGKDGLIGFKVIRDDSENQQSDMQAFPDLPVLTEAFEKQRSNSQVKQAGIVIKILHEDASGSRHQHFIVRLNSGQSLLIAYNIDLAPKVEGISEGTMISFLWRI